mmetsp:Transcript_43443/g.111125  ORF Transcript_43443/g.111125 Transcript_43443/m.111125 type:complete len:435 (-) Transcript_43443:344-1648(-)
MPMGFEPGTWWDAQCAAGGVPGQGQSMVADGGLTTARLRDGDAPLLGTPMLSQGKTFDLMAADALIVTPMLVNNFGEKDNALGTFLYEQSESAEEDDAVGVDDELKTGTDTDGSEDQDSSHTALRMSSHLSDDSATNEIDAVVADVSDDVLWDAGGPHLPDIVDLGKGSSMEADLPQAIGLAPLGLGPLGVVSCEDAMGFAGFPADTLDYASGADNTSPAVGLAAPSGAIQQGEMPKGAMMGNSLRAEEMGWISTAGGWSQAPASSCLQGDVEPPSKRSRSCGALDMAAICGANVEGAASGAATLRTPSKAPPPAAPRSAGKSRRASETGKLRSPRGAAGPGGKVTSPRGASKARKALALDGRPTSPRPPKKVDEWDLEPLPPKPVTLGPQACTNCATISTPLWRGGPHGPKTLCNACGVRYMKSAKRFRAPRP